MLVEAHGSEPGYYLGAEDELSSGLTSKYFKDLIKAKAAIMQLSSIDWFEGLNSADDPCIDT